jgi:IS5 family transposase
MRQWTFSSVGFETHGKQTRRHRFLTEMDAIVPRRKLFRLIEPHYPNGNRGRPPIGTDRMLRIYFLQVWFNLSDPGVEDALYDSAAMRDFVEIDLGREPAPDETTICKFRHLIEASCLGEALFDAVNAHLSPRGSRLVRAASWTRRSSRLRPRTRTKTASVTLRCIRPRKEINGILE